MHTIRDLSTCLGAWDLNVPTTTNSNKRQKLDDETNNNNESMNDGNADTAFQFYYERSCPILLDAKRSTSPSSPSSSSGPGGGGTMPYYVEDFGCSNNSASMDGSDYGESSREDSKPVVAGAVVLTYGADSKFTGGTGEEGVLTKAIIEFFYDDSVVVEKNEKVDDGKGGEQQQDTKVNEDALVEAEERIFARVDPCEEQSSLVKAALYALSPSSSNASSSSSPATSRNSTSSSSDDGVYIPTIWSGNTNRIYQYCLLGNFDDNGKERASKRLCVAIQKKTPMACGGGDTGPARGVCRITLTLSPASVLAKKQLMAKEKQDLDNNVELDSDNSTQTCSEVHRTIRRNLRILRPPKLTTVADPNDEDDMTQQPGKRRRRAALRRRSVTQQLLDPTLIVVGVRCQHELLVDADEVGKVYVNGALVVDCSKGGGADSLPAHTLFGVDFTLPPPSGDGEKKMNLIGSSDLPNKSILEREYGALLVDALVWSGQCDADVAGKLLGRLISGSTERPDDFEDASSNGGSRYHNSLPRMESCFSIKFDTISRPCLESIVLSSSVADPVGIGAKAIGTKFRMIYGKEAFPCEVGSSEKYRLQRLLGAQKIATIVPRRARDVLRRGSYLSIDDMASFLWTKGVGSTWDGDHSDAMRAAEAMEGAIKLLRKAGFKDIKPNKIRFVARKKLEPECGYGYDSNTSSNKSNTPSKSKLRCWYDSSSQSYYVSDAILFVEEEDTARDDGEGSVSSSNTAGQSSLSTSKDMQVAVDEDSTMKSQSPPDSKQPDGDVVKEVKEKLVDLESKSVKGDAAGKEEGNVPEASGCTASVGKEKKDGGADTDGQEKKDDVNDNTANVTIAEDGPKNDNATEIEEESTEKVPSKSIGQLKDDGNQKKMDENEEKPTSDTPEASIKNDAAKEAEDTPKGAPQDQTPSKRNDTKTTADDLRKGPRPASAEDAAYLLAFYIAKEHPDAMMLERFFKCHRS